MTTYASQRVIYPYFVLSLLPFGLQVALGVWLAINQPVLYKVPGCSKTDREIIEIPAYCGWHAGEPNVGQSRASQQFFIPRCFGLSLTINVTEYYAYQRKLSATVPDSSFNKNTESEEIKEK